MPMCLFMHVCMSVNDMSSVSTRVFSQQKRPRDSREFTGTSGALRSCFTLWPTVDVWWSEHLSQESSPPQSQTFCNLSPPSCWMASCFYLTASVLGLSSHYATYSCPLWLPHLSIHICILPRSHFFVLISFQLCPTLYKMTAPHTDSLLASF